MNGLGYGMPQTLRRIPGCWIGGPQADEYDLKKKKNWKHGNKKRNSMDEVFQPLSILEASLIHGGLYPRRTVTITKLWARTLHRDVDPIILSTHLCNKRFTITAILILLNLRVQVCFLLELLRWNNILYHVKPWTGILLFIRQFNCIFNSIFTQGFGTRETQTLPPQSLFPCKFLTVSYINSFLFYNLLGKKPLIISFLFLYKIDNSEVILHM